MSLSRIIFRDVPINAWIDRYETSHRNPVNRVFHTFGIPMIAVSIPLFLLAPLIRGFWRIPLSLFTLGWICQFLGHIAEGKPPEFLKDWRFLLVGLRWWLRTIGDAK
ncbi:MAG: Mpo1-like protein [Chthoniobacterales bacterium]